jgi:hypothetical protein
MTHPENSSSRRRSKVIKISINRDDVNAVVSGEAESIVQNLSNLGFFFWYHISVGADGSSVFMTGIRLKRKSYTLGTASDKDLSKSIIAAAHCAVENVRKAVEIHHDEYGNH